MLPLKNSWESQWGVCVKMLKCCLSDTKAKTSEFLAATLSTRETQYCDQIRKNLCNPAKNKFHKMTQLS